MLHANQTQEFYFTEIFWLDPTDHFTFEFGHQSKWSIEDDQTIRPFIMQVNGEVGLAHHADV